MYPFIKTIHSYITKLLKKPNFISRITISKCTFQFLIKIKIRFFKIENYILKMIYFQ